MIHQPPDCSVYTWSPCGEADWRQCSRCGKLVCEIHGDGLYPIRHSGIDPKRGVDMLCWNCVWAAYWLGEVSQGEDFQYINLR